MRKISDRVKSVHGLKENYWQRDKSNWCCFKLYSIFYKQLNVPIPMLILDNFEIDPNYKKTHF